MNYEFVSVLIPSTDASVTIASHISDGYYVDGVWQIGNDTCITFSKPIAA